MRVEFVPPEQMDLSQPDPDFALNQNLSAFKLNPKVARVLLPLVLGVEAVMAGTVQGFGSGGGVSPESTPNAPRASLVTDVPTAYILPSLEVEQVPSPVTIVGANSQEQIVPTVELPTMSLSSEMVADTSEQNDSGDQVTPDEAKNIMEKHMMDLSEYGDTLMISDVSSKFFNDLSQEAFGRAFNYKFMLPGLVLSDGVELNYYAPWEQHNVTFKGAYLYIYQPFENEPTNQLFPGELFPSQLVFRNKDGKIERIFIESWDPKSGEPPPF